MQQRYVSDQLTHFVGRHLRTRDGSADESAQFELLVRILNSGTISHPPHDGVRVGNVELDTSKKLSQNEMFVPEVVCFADIPLDDLAIHVGKYSRFGLAFRKSFLLEQSACPVLYIPTTARAGSVRGKRPKHPNLGDEFDDMAEEFHRTLVNAGFGMTWPSGFGRYRELVFFLVRRLFCLVKAFDPTLAEDDPDNFYMEREWRVIGYVNFHLSDVSCILVPSAYRSRLATALPAFSGEIIEL